ncbi:MAG: Lrp/AsnC family transcriptional regulator [Desulfuromonadales bacterium]|nr:Lrp/AsnC family transcriptional regulator [Desulfuromonadales bacterium]MBN2790898.1 Lrp/AsnC family transcriptional regulator [Desulfuromonadales bacterium]
MKLDRIDIEIIRLLQNNARLSNKQIAAEVELAPSSVYERLKRLWDSGVLVGAHAEVDAKAMGVGLEALFMIQLSRHERGIVDQIMDEMLNIPEVKSAHLVTGHFDLIVHVVVRDTFHLKNLGFDQFTSRPGVTRIETSIVFESRINHELPCLREA